MRVQALESRPELDVLDVWYLRAAMTLSGDRDGMHGMLGFVPVLEYARLLELTADETFELHQVVTRGLHLLQEWQDKRKEKKR